MAKTHVTTTINGEPVEFLCDTRQTLLDVLRDEGLDPGTSGKGRATWLAYGYVLASNVSRVIAVHDCDILNYDRELLARLCYPTANPNLHYEFAKGIHIFTACFDDYVVWTGDVIGAVHTCDHTNLFCNHGGFANLRLNQDISLHQLGLLTSLGASDTSGSEGGVVLASNRPDRVVRCSHKSDRRLRWSQR